MARFLGKSRGRGPMIHFCQSGARIGGLARALARIASAGRWARNGLIPLGLAFIAGESKPRGQDGALSGMAGRPLADRRIGGAGGRMEFRGFLPLFFALIRFLVVPSWLSAAGPLPFHLSPFSPPHSPSMEIRALPVYDFRGSASVSFPVCVSLESMLAGLSAGLPVSLVLVPRTIGDHVLCSIPFHKAGTSYPANDRRGCPIPARTPFLVETAHRAATPVVSLQIALV